PSSYLSTYYSSFAPSLFYLSGSHHHRQLHSFPTRRSSDLAGTRVSYTNVDYNRILSSSSNNYSALRAALFTNPVFSPYDPVTGELVDWLGQREMRNPLAMAEKVPINFFQDRITLNQFVSADLMEGLTLRTSLYMSFDKTKQSSFQPKTFDSATPRRDFGKFRQGDVNKF